MISVADPEHPEDMGRFDALGMFSGIAVSGNYAYVANAERGLRVLSIANLEHIEEVGYYDTPGIAHKVALSEDGFIYLADGTNVGIYRFTDPAEAEDSLTFHPSSFTLYPAYPNPFNSTTTIRFGLDKSAPTRLAIYDPSGRLVEVLLPGIRLLVGNYQIVWNAKELAAGSYFCHLSLDDCEITRQITLIK